MRTPRGWTLVALLASASTASSPDRPSSDYAGLVRAYARGDRMEAIATLARWSDEDLRRQLHTVQTAARAAERCPACPGALEELPLRAAVMLHSDRDQADRPRSMGTEQPRACPGRHAEMASQYAAVMALREDTRDFARRFYLAMAESCQWDFCLDASVQWSGQGLERFPRDPELLFAAGCIYEEAATLGSPLASMPAPRRPPGARDVGATAEEHREWALKQARRHLADAVAADGRLALARVRLGRVLWQLGDREAARKTLEEAVERSVGPVDLYLARLFLGRVHEDAARLDQAVREYSLAVDLDPQGQAAAVALSHAWRLIGDAERARRTLDTAVGRAGRRTARDAYWDYLAANAASASQLFAALRQESLE